MSCVICKKGTTNDGKTTVTLTRGITVVIIKEVPAQVCENCGEYYLDEDIAARVYAIAEEAVKRGLELEVLQYAA